MKAKVPKTYTQEYLDEYLMWLDMIVLMVLHEEYGFGAERLKRYYRAICPMADRYGRYDDHREPDFGKRTKKGLNRTSIWKLKKDLFDLGFDYDAIVNEEDEKTARELEAARERKRNK